MTKTKEPVLSNEKEAPWQVDFTGKARKQKEKLPAAIAAALYVLRKELEAEGP
jgi:mRNA-degrading endonuclease RelE of RelBE toxin-antitoxin system